MNGAESLVQTLLNCGVDTCFANPGTSEMHFVSALDRIEGMRSILCLFEGVVTGAADGYGRMTGKPAATLLHLGPGLAYGGPNLHNARRARSPVVNIVGDHATYHLKYDAPLTSDVAAISGAVSDWTHRSDHAGVIALDAAEAVQVATTSPGQVATLILPADTAWGAAERSHEALEIPSPPQIDVAPIEAAATLLASRKTVIILGDAALDPGVRLIAKGIADSVGATILAPVSNKRIDRGRGTVPVERIPYPVDQAIERLAEFEAAILVGAMAPVAFFAYPEKSSELLPDGCEVCALTVPGDDHSNALMRLAKRIGATPALPPSLIAPPKSPDTDKITPETIAAVLAAMLPENAIVCDESITVGRSFFPATQDAAPHSWLQITGGAIGCGIPLATGAAVACPNRKVVALIGDGSALYTVQALWTQARENLDVVTLILSNRSYSILKGELRNVGAQAGKTAQEMLTLENPTVQWCELARGFGVQAVSVASVGALVSEFQAALKRKGPSLIEVVVDAT